MKFSLINRRTHLYLAMFLLPWVLVYGVSSVVFAHHDWFDGNPEWTTLIERDYDRPVPEGKQAQRTFGATLLDELGLEGSFGTYMPSPKQLNVYVFDFWGSTDIKYYIDEHRLVVRQPSFRWSNFLTGLHARGGFDQDAFLPDAWAVVVDLVCLAFLIWVTTGIIMWWQMRQLRRWGAVALGSGAALFTMLLLLL